MARVGYVEYEALSHVDRPLLRHPINLRKALANDVSALRVFTGVATWTHESSLGPRLRELAILQVARTTGCSYMFSHHVKISRDAGVNDGEIRGLSSNSVEAFDAGTVERAVVETADRLTRDLVVSDDVWDALRSELDEVQALDLVLIVSYYNHLARVMLALELEVEPEYMRLFDAFRTTDVPWR